MSPLTLQLLAAFACAIVGFIAGVLVTLLWSEKEKKIANGTASAEPAVDKSRVEVARIWRDKKTGNLLTEIDGKVYKDEGELSKTQRTELKYTAMSWAGWVLGNEETPAPGPEVKPAAAAPAAVIAQPAPLPPVPAPPPVRAPAEDAKTDKGGNKKGKAEEPPRPKTMVEQIDEILAEQIKGSPLENRGLRIVQNNVGVTVWVGLDHYDGIDSVTDPEIKAAVRRAVETWEKQAVQNK
jgi:hypothetical protein